MFYIFKGSTGETIYVGHTDAEKFTEGQSNSYQKSFYKGIGSSSMYEFSVKLVALQLEGYEITEVDSDEELITCYTKPEKPTGKSIFRVCPSSSYCNTYTSFFF